MDIGARLRNAREDRGLTIDAVSRSTRVQPKVLSAIERNDSISLPPRPYGRGFVRAYASEVGLDPEGTVRDFFSQFAPAEAPVPSGEKEADAVTRWPAGQRWLWPVGAAIGYALVGALVIVIGRWAFVNNVETGAVGTAGSAIPAAAPSIERQPAPAPPAPAPPPGVIVSLEARQASWITASVDGQRTHYRLLQPGERLNLNGTREVSVRIGDAGAVVWKINNGGAAPMGLPGQVRTVVVTPQNAREMR